MSAVRRLTQAALATAVAGTVGGAAMLAAEAVAARNRRYAQPSFGLAIRSAIGRSNAPRVRLVLLGDSTALGVGVERVSDTVGGQLAELLAGGPGQRRVEVSTLAVASSRAADLGAQVARALVGPRPDVAVVLIGGSDVVRLASPVEAAEQLGAAVHRLREVGIPVVVGTCPDLGAARAFAQPLRQIAGWQARRLVREQTATVRAAGGVAVDLGALTGAVFRADAGTLCHDGYHPSADGYRVWAHALLPAVAEALAAGAERA